MSKKKIQVSIKNALEEATFETEVIEEEKTLKYLDQAKTKTIFQKDKNILIRENKELKMEYFFEEGKKSEGIIHIKEYKKDMKVQIQTQKLRKNDKEIEIHFTVENNEFLYKIKII